MVLGIGSVTAQLCHRLNSYALFSGCLSMSIDSRNYVSGKSLKLSFQVLLVLRFNINFTAYTFVYNLNCIELLIFTFHKILYIFQSLLMIYRFENYIYSLSMVIYIEFINHSA